MATPTVDINHPRQCLIMWRAQADDLARHISDHPDMTVECRIFQAAVNTLRKCADQLENRLQWSGLD